MNHDSDNPQELFSFGTLLDPAVQMILFGRRLESVPDSLLNHALTEVKIIDPNVIAASGSGIHKGLARAEGMRVDGEVILLDNREVLAADAYEVSSYCRRRVLLSSLRQAWAYVDASPLSAAQRIGIIGDSIAYGRSDPAGGWSHRLSFTHISRDEKNHRFFNLAIPGVSAAALNETAVSELSLRRCDTVIIACGINDLLHGASIEITTDRVQSLAIQIESIGARPVVLSLPWIDVDRAEREFGLSCGLHQIAAVNQNLYTWATSKNRDYLDIFTSLQNRSELLSDGLHPTAEGHHLLACDMVKSLF